ncbi:MAG: AraC family transcriptional regulator [Ruminococcaceae bacterium]|nr:AraC family transcriptional regulator [Oscillospiraceae bacterium]
MSNIHLIKKAPLKNIITISSIITINCYELAPTYFNKGEIHDFWEIVYLDRGELDLYAGDKRLKLKQGEIIFHKPNEFHSIECDGKHSASVFIVTFVCHSSAMKYFRDKLIKVPSDMKPLIKRLIDECTNTFRVSQYPLTLLPSVSVGGTQLIRIYLEEFFIRLLRIGEQKNSGGSSALRDPSENALISEIESYLAEHVCERVTLEDISGRLHFGKSHLCDIFKKGTGQTIMQYHMKLKIDEAKRLLKENKLTVNKISEKLGFETPAYFSRAFSKHVGMSPRAYRNALVSDGRVYLEKETPLR